MWRTDGDCVRSHCFRYVIEYIDLNVIRTVGVTKGRSVAVRED